MLEQRIVYIKKLLDDSGLKQYGITEAEIKSFASRPMTETITNLIELTKLADNTVMDTGTDVLYFEKTTAVCPNIISFMNDYDLLT